MFFYFLTLRIKVKDKDTRATDFNYFQLSESNQNNMDYW